MIDHSVPCLPPLCEDEVLDEVNEQIRLIRKKNGLTFGTDAYLLAAYVKSMPSATVVDLGSGTGILPLLLLAKGKVANAVAVEIQPAFAELIQKNAEINGFRDRIRTLCADVRDLRSEDVGGEVPLVISNPPYMKVDAGKRNEHDEKFVARHEVFGTIADFCTSAARLLKHGGKFVCVWRPDRLTELFYALHDARLEPKRVTLVHADESAEPCCALIESVKGASPGVRISPPLFLYEPSQESKKRTLTVQAQKIYDTCTFFD
jgi:tRNA1Val (adenine37-N6)-methyltransferase